MSHIALVRFTLHNAENIYISPTWIQAVRRSLTSEEGNTTIILSGHAVGVMEFISEVLEALR